MAATSRGERVARRLLQHMQQSKKRYTIQIPANVHAALTEVAKLTNTSISTVVEQLTLSVDLHQAIEMIKSSNVKVRRVGRPKRSYHNLDVEKKENGDP